MTKKKAAAKKAPAKKTAKKSAAEKTIIQWAERRMYFAGVEAQKNGTLTLSLEGLDGPQRTYEKIELRFNERDEVVALASEAELIAQQHPDEDD